MKVGRVGRGESKSSHARLVGLCRVCYSFLRIAGSGFVLPNVSGEVSGEVARTRTIPDQHSTITGDIVHRPQI